MRGRKVTIALIAGLIGVGVAAAVWAVVPRSSDDGPVLLPVGSLWRFDDSGRDLGVEWRQADFDDSSWAVAAAPFGYGQDVTTEISYGRDRQAKPVTSYFRTGFQVPADVPGIEMRLRRDDGAVVYLNGTEVLRTGIANGDVTSATIARYAQEDGRTWITAELPPEVVAPGPNSVAVEIHQSAPDSSDLFFDLEISEHHGEFTPLTPVPPDATRVLAAGDIGECGGAAPETSPQYRWLVADLARSSERCLAAAWHHPRYSSSEYGDDEEVSPLFRAMVDAGGEFVLNGHAHFYERFARMSDDNRPSDIGMREFIVGTGGANLYRSCLHHQTSV